MDRLMHPWPGYEAPGESHCIVGGDSDILLMALLSPTPGVHVLSDVRRLMCLQQ